MAGARLHRGGDHRGHGKVLARGKLGKEVVGTGSEWRRKRKKMRPVHGLNRGRARLIEGLCAATMTRVRCDFSGGDKAGVRWVTAIRVGG